MISSSSLGVGAPGPGDPPGDAADGDAVAGFVEQLQHKGMVLWLENGGLRYRAPKGALTRFELERLSVHKDQVRALLERARDAQGRESGRPRLSQAPLAFSQLAHWQIHQLGERCVSRNVASATRLSGRLNIEALSKAMAEVVRRHDALRTRIVVAEGVPLQMIDSGIECDLRIDDLTPLQGSERQSEIMRRIESFMLEPVDVSTGPLFGARILKLTDTEWVLILALEHIISDAVTLDIALREILTAYAQAAQGHAISLPAVPFQFSEYASWQRNTHRSWVERHGQYWNDHFRGCGRVRFPDGPSRSGAAVGWSSIPLQIRTGLRAELGEWCRSRRASLPMAVFTAYAALVLRWCGVPSAVVRYQSDGRAGPRLHDTLGFFASRLYLRVDLRENDSFLSLLERVTEEYCSAVEHDDFTYMETQTPPPESSRNTFFNWIPQPHSSGIFGSPESENVIQTHRVPFVNPWFRNLEWDNEPMTLLYDADGEITGRVYFSLQRLSVTTMERFGRHFVVFIERLLRAAEDRIGGIPF